MLYDIAFLIFSMIYLPTLLFKGKLHRDFLERFGIYDADKKDVLLSGSERIWVQAVSVGEVALCKTLIPELKARFPANRIILSTITRTGNDLARKLFSEDAVIIYFPLDFSMIARLVVRLIRPKIYIMIETEIWPNVLREVSRLAVRSILVNGRISDNSFGKYKFARRLLKNVLGKISVFCMQSRTDAERIIELGADPGKVKVTGNMKFDTDVAIDAKKADGLRDLLCIRAGDELFVAGSTHPGEEEIVLDAYGKLVKEFPNLKLLIAPRHIERAREVEKIIKQFNFKPIRVSAICDPRSPITDHRIFILDAIGQLKDAYAIATLVFIGGSLVRHGGQNPIEPAMLEKPVVFGPHMFNFKEISRSFLDSDAALQVADKEDLVVKSRLLLKDGEKRKRLGRLAREVVRGHRGATEENLKAIDKLIVDS